MRYRRVLYQGSYHSGLLSGAAGADTATGGRFWIINGGAALGTVSPVLLGIKRVLFTTVIPAAQSVAHTRVTIEQMTFTGVASGATGVPAPRRSTMTLDPNVSIRTASTGLTPVAGAVIGAGICGWQVPVTAAGQGVPQPYDLMAYPDNEGFVFGNGEGLVVRQADAGDTDQKFMLDIDFEVFVHSMR